MEGNYSAERLAATVGEENVFMLVVLSFPGRAPAISNDNGY